MTLVGGSFSDLGSAPQSAIGTYAVQPRVDSASPASLPQGRRNASVTVSGGNFAPGAFVSISGDGITVDSTNIDSSSQITLSLTIDATASLGARTITVTNPDTSFDAGVGTLTITAPAISIDAFAT